MSKRCCAASCYNSVATNRSVEYFGFPKSQEYATAWAKAAGREDLLEKNINNIIKYFLCSEHFSDDCFLDPPQNRKLKKTSRPVVVPIPTIFQNNFDQCVSKSLHEEKRIMKTVVDERDSLLLDVSDGVDVVESISVPTELEEHTLLATVHQFIAGSDEHNEHERKEEAEQIGQDEEVEEEEEGIIQYEIKEEIVRIDEDEVPPEAYNEEEDEGGAYSAIVIGPMNCRLCLEAKDNELLIPIFGDGSEVAYILETLMPNMIKPDDGLPQQICLECLESVTRCLSTIEKFKSIQDRLRTLH